ncbi:MAG: MarR family transcriptional regulator [Rhodospirillales bacterium]
MKNTSFSAVLHLLRARSRLAEKFTGPLGSVHGLALNEVLLLMHLERAPMQRLSRIDLAKRLSVSASTVTRMAAPLEKLRLVGREADARDARLSYVVLTKAGVRLVTDARQTLEQLSAEVFKDRWTETEIQQLGKLLARMTASQPGELP